MVTLYKHIVSCRWDSTQAFTFLDVVKPVHISGHSCDGWYLFLHSHSFDGIPQHLLAMEIISKNILIYSLFFSLFCNNHPKLRFIIEQKWFNSMHAVAYQTTYKMPLRQIGTLRETASLIGRGVFLLSCLFPPLKTLQYVLFTCGGEGL